MPKFILLIIHINLKGEVNENSGTVKIHFDGWSNTFGEQF
jgi:hypothetical protein